MIQSCGGGGLVDERSQKWSSLYSNNEKISITYSIAKKDFDDAKRLDNGNLLIKAKEGFSFLADQFQHERSSRKLAEIETFLKNRDRHYQSLIEAAKKKNYIFTTAGYYKKLLNYFPDNQEAIDYQSRYKTEIKKRLNTNLDLGFKYIKQKKFNSAKRCFNRVLTFEPNSRKAKNGIKQVKYYKRQQQLIAKKNANKKIKTKKLNVKAKLKPIKVEEVQLVKVEEIEEVPELSNAEKAEFYAAGVKAYNAKDFLKAFDLFDAIDDEKYKDTIHYLNRSEEKIQTLGLTED